MKAFNTAWGRVSIEMNKVPCGKHQTCSTVRFVPVHLEEAQIGISLCIEASEAACFGKAEADLFALKVEHHLQPYTGRGTQ